MAPKYNYCVNCGEAIEVQENEDSKIYDPSLGAFGTNAYMYKSDLAILRVSFDVVPYAATAYENIFFEIVGK